MSPYERRRGGNAPPGGLEAAPARVTPAPGKGALGTRWPRQSVGTRHRAGFRGACIVAKGRCKLHRVGAKGAPAPQFRAVGEGRPEKWRAEPRPEPDSGNPTVRDRRGASGNVASWSMISTRRARLISISTRARWDLRGGRPATPVPTATVRMVVLEPGRAVSAPSPAGWREAMPLL